MLVMFRSKRFQSEKRRSQREKAISSLAIVHQARFRSRGRPDREDGTRLRLFFDQFPDTREKMKQFKGIPVALPYADAIRHAKLQLSPA